MSAINESFIFVALWPIGAVLFCLLEMATRWVIKKMKRKPRRLPPRGRSARVWRNEVKGLPGSSVT